METFTELKCENSIKPDGTVVIAIERYDELIKKEAILDELLKNNDVLVMLIMKNKEEK